MSWLYGQTWLWYLIAFLVGVLLAWLVLVRPQLRRLRALDASSSTTPPSSTTQPRVDEATTERFQQVGPPAVLLAKGDPSPDTAAGGTSDADTAVIPRNLVAAGLADREPAHETPVEKAPTAAADETPVGESTGPSFVPGPYPGSALPTEDGSAPTPEFTIKGNADSGLYHTPSSPYYSRTRAEAWFTTTEDAEAAGFTGWTRK